MQLDVAGTPLLVIERRAGWPVTLPGSIDAHRLLTRSAVARKIPAHPVHSRRLPYRVIMKAPPSVVARLWTRVGVDWGARPINFRVQFLDASGDVIIAE